MKNQYILRPLEIPEEFLKQVYKNGGVVCGGFARHLASSNRDSSANDIDIYPRNSNSLRNLLVLLDKISNTGGWGVISEPTDYNGLRVSNLFITSHTDQRMKVQLVHMPMNPEKILHTFDFTVCQAYLDFYNNKVVTPLYWKQHEDARLLRLTDSNRNYLAYRLIKYIEKGYSPDYNTIMTFMARMKLGEGNGDTATSDMLAHWLAMVHIRLGNENTSLRDQISVLGQLLDNESFQGKHLI